jgi:HPt (histidine-containing phosphotransfer) domain-containing protein
MMRALAGANRPGENRTATDVLGEFVALFSRDAPARLTLIREGRASGQPLIVADAAHALKGAAATLGAARVQALAHAIELLAKGAVATGVTELPMTAVDAALVDQLVHEVDVALEAMHVEFLGGSRPAR